MPDRVLARAHEGRRAPRAFLAKVLVASVTVVTLAGCGVMLPGSAPLAENGADEPAASASAGPNWTLRPISVERMCGRRGATYVRSLLRPRTSEVPYRLADHLLRESPFPDHRATFDGAWEPGTPWRDVLARWQPVGGRVRSFAASDRAGGYSLSVLEYPTKARAVAAASSAFGTYVCEGSATPHALVQRRGIVVAEGLVKASTTLAMWVHADRVMMVDYHMWGEHDADVAAALTVVEAAWHHG